MKQTVMVLGNCVADRLRLALAQCPSFAERYTLIPSPMIHTIPETHWPALAHAATQCSKVLTQPLFSFGPCNTAVLLQTIPRDRFVIFPSPNFEAYFPDVFGLRGKTNLRFDPILDWDSRIVFSCFVAGISIFEVAERYLKHALFQRQTMEIAVEKALVACHRRDEGVDVPIAGFIERNFDKIRMFHSWQHPDTPLLVLLLAGILDALELPREESRFAVAVESFGFNRWPVLSGDVFSFPEQTNFILGGQEVSLEDAAMAYYNFYEFHPQVVEENLDAILPVD